MGIYAEKKNISPGGSKAEVTKFMANEPKRIVKIKVDLILPDEIADDEWSVLVKIAVNCPAAKSLRPDTEQK